MVKYTYTPAMLENGRYRYEETDEPVASIAADFDRHPRSFRKMAARLGWRRRSQRPPRDLPADLRLLAEAEAALRAGPQAAAGPSADAAEGAAPAGDGEVGEAQAAAATPAPSGRSLAERLEREIERQIRAVEVRHGQFGAETTSAEAERTARTLSRLTDTLARVQRLRTPAPTYAESPEDEDMPGDVDEFRRRLAERIRAFVRGRRAGRAVPAGGGSPDAGAPR